jgi:hypothetical protein
MYDMTLGGMVTKAYVLPKQEDNRKMLQMDETRRRVKENQDEEDQPTALRIIT